MSVKKAIQIVLSAVLCIMLSVGCLMVSAEETGTQTISFSGIVLNDAVRIVLPRKALGSDSRKVYVSTQSGLSGFSGAQLLLENYNNPFYYVPCGIGAGELLPDTQYWFYYDEDGVVSSFYLKTAPTASYWTDEGNFDVTWYNETDTSFSISSPSQLAGLAVLVLGGNTFENKTVSLSASIDLSAHFWTPIGTYSLPFKGTFDGQANIISRLKTSTSKRFQGLFGYTIIATVRNVILSDSTITASFYTGGIVGFKSAGLIENCINYADITSLDGNGGGIVGSNGSDLKDCYNYGNIAGEYCMGGIAASNKGLVSGCSNYGTVTSTTIRLLSSYTGGIAGYNGGTVDNCINNGNVSSGKAFVGGIVGMNDSNMFRDIIISGCSNTGKITASGCAGGIAGRSVSQNTNQMIIKNCNNSGTVSSGGNVGGIVGLLQTFSGGTQAQVKDCTNSGIVSGNRNSVGGIVGRNLDSLIENCTDAPVLAVLPQPLANIVDSRPSEEENSIETPEPVIVSDPANNNIETSAQVKVTTTANNTNQKLKVVTVSNPATEDGVVGAFAILLIISIFLSAILLKRRKSTCA